MRDVLPGDQKSNVIAWKRTHRDTSSILDPAKIREREIKVLESVFPALFRKFIYINRNDMKHERGEGIIFHATVLDVDRSSSIEVNGIPVDNHRIG